MKAPFTYYGGKQRLGNRIVELLPDHKIYVEPFCGGAGVFWRKPRKEVSNADDYREILNDTNAAIVDVLRVLRDRPDELGRLLRLLPYSDAEFKRARDVYQGKTEVPELGRAALLFLFFSASYSGKATGGMKRGKSSENPAMTWARKPERVPAWAARLAGVYIEDVDWEKCIERWDTPNTTFYCDPPYVGANQGHYGGWTMRDQRRLVNRLAACRGSFALSGYGDDVTDSMGWTRHDMLTTVSAKRDSRKSKVERLWVRPAK